MPVPFPSPVSPRRHFISSVIATRVRTVQEDIWEKEQPYSHNFYHGYCYNCSFLLRLVSLLLYLIYELNVGEKTVYGVQDCWVSGLCWGLEMYPAWVRGTMVLKRSAIPFVSRLPSLSCVGIPACTGCVSASHCPPPGPGLLTSQCWLLFVLLSTFKVLCFDPWLLLL